MAFEYVFFGKLADIWSVLGGSIIIGGSFWVALGKRKGQGIVEDVVEEEVGLGARQDRV